jgi:hypothetical protein
MKGVFQCSSLCQLYITKEILSRSANSGEKVSTEIPEDILVTFKSLPIMSERYNQIDLHDAFEAVQNICDNCPSDLNSKHCVVNVVFIPRSIVFTIKNCTLCCVQFFNYRRKYP